MSEYNYFSVDGFLVFSIHKQNVDCNIFMLLIIVRGILQFKNNMAG